MRYQVILKPETASNLVDAVVDENGIRRAALVIGVVSDEDVAAAMAGTDNAAVALAVLNNTIQPSSAQKAGLLGYIAAVEAETDTAAVESAVSELS